MQSRGVNIESAHAALILALIKGEKNSIDMWSSFWNLQLDFIFGNRIIVCVRTSYPILCPSLTPKKRLPKQHGTYHAETAFLFFFLRLQRVKTEIRMDENIFIVVQKWFGILGMCQWQELNSPGCGCFEVSAVQGFAVQAGLAVGLKAHGEATWLCNRLNPG